MNWFKRAWQWIKTNIVLVLLALLVISAPTYIETGAQEDYKLKLTLDDPITRTYEYKGNNYSFLDYTEIMNTLDFVQETEQYRCEQWLITEQNKIEALLDLKMHNLSKLKVEDKFVVDKDKLKIKEPLNLTYEKSKGYKYNSTHLETCSEQLHELGVLFEILNRN